MSAPDPHRPISASVALATDVADAHARSGSVQVLGRLFPGPRLADATGVIALQGALGTAQPGDLVRATGRVQDGPSGRVLEVVHLEVLQKGRLPPPGARRIAGPERWLGDAAALANLGSRYAFVRAVRDWLTAHGLLEVDVPSLLAAAGTDVHIEPVEVRLHDAGGRAQRGFLHTSPELCLKRLLVAGFPRVFFLGSVFRSGELSQLHQVEFLMAEWYRAGATYEDMMRDVEALVADLLGGQSRKDGVALPIPRVIPRLSVRDAFLEETGVDLARCADAAALAAALAERGLPARDAAFDALFFRVFVERVEPKLARRPAVFLVDYPAPLAALARLKPGAPLFAERFELYIRGVELANGYTELNDPAEQRARFEADLRARRAQGLSALPLPEDFLRALEIGMPPAGGVSLGVDRLFMLKAGVNDIRDVVAFSWESESSGPPQLP